MLNLQTLAALKIVQEAWTDVLSKERFDDSQFYMTYLVPHDRDVKKRLPSRLSARIARRLKTLVRVVRDEYARFVDASRKPVDLKAADVTKRLRRLPDPSVRPLRWMLAHLNWTHNEDFATQLDSVVAHMTPFDFFALMKQCRIRSSLDHPCR